MADAVFINYPGIQFLMEGPEMSLELERVASFIVAKTKENLEAVQYNPRNPAPAGGPPRRRSGDLANSIRQSEPRRLEGQQTVAIYADEQATHRGWRYDQSLRLGGANGSTGYGPFVFVDLDTVSVP